MDRMRESLFAILGDLSGLSFLDLFSGSGVVAIEAASRGAEPIVLVEMDRGKKETIEKNLSFVEEEIPPAGWYGGESCVGAFFGSGVYRH